MPSDDDPPNVKDLIDACGFVAAEHERLTRAAEHYEREWADVDSWVRDYITQRRADGEVFSDEDADRVVRQHASEMRVRARGDLDRFERKLQPFISNRRPLTEFRAAYVQPEAREKNEAIADLAVALLGLVSATGEAAKDLRSSVAFALHRLDGDKYHRKGIGQIADDGVAALKRAMSAHPRSADKSGVTATVTAVIELTGYSKSQIYALLKTRGITPAN